MIAKRYAVVHYYGSDFIYFRPSIRTAILLFCTNTLDVYTGRISKHDEYNI